MTVALIVQPVVGMFAAVMPRVLAPAAPVSTAPAQVELKFGVAASTTLLGKLSFKAAPVIATVLALARVIVNTDVAPVLMLAGAKAFCTAGGVDRKSVV